MSDIYHAKDRNTAMTLFSAAALFGTGFGPLICGFIAYRTTWRWCVDYLINTTMKTYADVFGLRIFYHQIIFDGVLVSFMQVSADTSIQYRCSQQLI